MSLKSTDIVLIVPIERWRYHRYSLGVLYISAHLAKNSYENIIIERQTMKDIEGKFDHKLPLQERVVAHIKELNPKIVGYTACIQEFHGLINLHKELKKNFDFISIVGGPQSTVRPTEFLESGIDVAVTGEGEETMLELVKLIDKIFSLQKSGNEINNVRNELKRELKDFTGLAYRMDNQNIVNQPRPYIDISNLAIPAYEKIDMDFYLNMWDGTIRGVPLRGAIIMTSRGCPYQCKFCECNKVYGQKVRYRSVDNIKKELKILKNDYGIEGVWLADDTFTLSREHIFGVGKTMKDLGIIWGCQARVNLVDEDLIKSMKDNGCVQFDFGVESGSQRILDDIMNKKTNLGQVKQAFALCKQYKIRTCANFMMGLPTETKEEMEATIGLAKELKANYNVLPVFTPLPGTALYDEYFDGQINKDDYNDLEFFTGNEKFNKSEVKDIKKYNTRWRKELATEMKKNNIRAVWFYIKIFFKLKNKKQRAKFAYNKIKNFLVGVIKNRVAKID